MAAIKSFSIAALSPLGSGAIWRASDTMKCNFYDRSATLPPKLVKGDLRIIHQNVERLSLCRKYFSFSQVEPFA